MGFVHGGRLGNAWGKSAPSNNGGFRPKAELCPLSSYRKGETCLMGKKIRLGRLEREQTRLAARWRASQVNDNLQVSLRDVTEESEISSPMSVAHMQSKGARGGYSPYGRTERFERKQPANTSRFGNR